jgi:hypothetical protein
LKKPPLFSTRSKFAPYATIPLPGNDTHLRTALSKRHGEKQVYAAARAFLRQERAARMGHNDRQAAEIASAEPVATEPRPEIKKNGQASSPERRAPYPIAYLPAPASAS